MTKMSLTSSTNAILRTMNLEKNSIAMIIPDYYNKMEPINEFSILAASVGMRVVIIVEEYGEMKASLDYLHSRITGKYSSTKVVYNLTSGGTVRVLLYDDYYNNILDFVPDVLLINLFKVTISMISDIKNFEYNKKMVLITSSSQEYLSAFFGFYKIIY